MTAEEGHARVRDWQIKRYGTRPLPLRSYLTNDEAREISSQCPSPSLLYDLDLRGYGCRFKNAVEESIRYGLDPATWEFWHKARLYFFEIGGCYKPGMEPPSKKQHA